MKSGSRWPTARTGSCDVLMYATGRAHQHQGLGLEEAGVKMADNGADWIVDEQFRPMSNRSTPSATWSTHATDAGGAGRGMVVADRLFNTHSRQMDYQFRAHGGVQPPNVGTVGLTERRRAPNMRRENLPLQLQGRSSTPCRTVTKDP